MKAVTRPQIDLGDHAIILVVVMLIGLVGNTIGPNIPIAEAIPGMLIIYAITIVGLVITKYAPFYLPSVAWISLVAILLTLPWTPGSEWILQHVVKVNVLALATPVLAYAGLAITKHEAETFRHSGWKIIIVALFVFIGTYLGSATVAQIVLQLQGLI